MPHDVLRGIGPKFMPNWGICTDDCSLWNREVSYNLIKGSLLLKDEDIIRDIFWCFEREEDAICHVLQKQHEVSSLVNPHRIVFTYVISLIGDYSLSFHLFVDELFHGGSF